MGLSTTILLTIGGERHDAHHASLHLSQEYTRACTTIVQPKRITHVSRWLLVGVRGVVCARGKPVRYSRFAVNHTCYQVQIAVSLDVQTNLSCRRILQQQ